MILLALPWALEWRLSTHDWMHSMGLAAFGGDARFHGCCVPLTRQTQQSCAILCNLDTNLCDNAMA